MDRDRKNRHPIAERDSDTVGGSQHSQPATGGRDTAAIADSRGNLHLLPYADAAAGTHSYGDGCRVVIFGNGDCVFIPFDYTGPGHSSGFAYATATSDDSTDTDTATSAESDSLHPDGVQLPSGDLHPAPGMRIADTATDVSTDS